MRKSAAIVALFVGASSAAACEVTSRSVNSVSMRVRPGEACDYPVTLSPPRGKGDAQMASETTGEILGLTIVKRPGHGKAGAFGRAGVAYMAAPGYVGTDSFTAQYQVRANGATSTRSLSVSVQIAR